MFVDIVPLIRESMSFLCSWSVCRCVHTAMATLHGDIAEWFAPRSVIIDADTLCRDASGIELEHAHVESCPPRARRNVSEQELQEVVSRVCAQEAEDDIPQWSQADAPASVLPPDQLPKPGRVVSRRELPTLGATELVLSNGMRVRHVLRCPHSRRSLVPWSVALIGCCF